MRHQWERPKVNGREHPKRNKDLEKKIYYLRPLAVFVDDIGALLLPGWGTGGSFRLTSYFTPGAYQ